MRAIVFDWDGTLVDTLGAIYRANLAVLGTFGLPFDEAAYRRHYAPDWRVMYARLGVPEERLVEANDHWLRSFGGTDLGTPFPGVLEATERLAAAGYLLGLVTAGHRDVVEPQLLRAGLAGTIKVRVYGDDLPVHKPDPRPLRVALAELGLATGRTIPGRAWYVGDAPDDMRMATHAGATGVGIESLLGDREELLAAGATIVAPTVAAWVDALLAEDPSSPPASRADAR